MTSVEYVFQILQYLPMCITLKQRQQRPRKGGVRHPRGRPPEPRGDRGPGGGQRGGLRGPRRGSLRVHRGGDPGGHDFGRDLVAEAPWNELEGFYPAW